MTMLTHYMYQERMEEEDLLALKTVLMHRYNGIWKHGGLITAIKDYTDNTMANRMIITRKQR